MPEQRTKRTAIAVHKKTGRWVACHAFNQASGKEAEAYVNHMNNLADNSHERFEIFAGDWTAAKEECRQRNEKLNASLSHQGHGQPGCR